MKLFFDTETNGLPKNYKGSVTDLNNWPRVIQLAWQLYNDEGVKQSEGCDLIRPDGWTIPEEKFWIDNGYSNEKSMTHGIPFLWAAEPFIDAINIADTMIAHNLDFDYPIVAAEMIRYNLRAENKPQKFCTMKATTGLLKLPGKYGYKWPTLTELHTYCFGIDFDGAHDALEDVAATARCYFHLNQNSLLTF